MLTNDSDGDFDLIVKFHDEDLSKDKQKQCQATIDELKYYLIVFEGFKKAFSEDRAIQNSTVSKDRFCLVSAW